MVLPIVILPFKIVKVIRRVELTSFKAFERFSATLRGDAFLAGPNNAGKSTLIAALRMATHMVRIAERRAPTDEILDRGSTVQSFQFAASQVGLIEENLRHEFRDVETRVAIRFGPGRGGSTLTAVWPPEGVDPGAFFYVAAQGVSMARPAHVSAALPRIGLVPILTPIDHEETVLTPKYVRENLDGRLASRHFRNQLALLRDEHNPNDGLQAFFDFAGPWLAELRLGQLREVVSARGVHLDLYYTEPGRRSDKEIFWAGDGIQVWLQLLLHLFRLRNSDVIILDEPDVYLHPDLQRRLVQLLETLPGQTITATHSPEMLVEAPPESVVWIEKTRRTSKLAPDTAVLNELVTAIGSHFNIRLARALRATTALFVEGDDMTMLRHLAATVGATRVATESGIAVVSLGGYSNWDRVEPFVWLARDLLEESVRILVILDRDYRSAAQCESVRRKFRQVGVYVHIWKRKELESYLLVSSAIARIAGTPENVAEAIVAEEVEALERTVWHALKNEREVSRRRDDPKTVVAEARAEFLAAWGDPSRRLAMVPPKELLSRVNQRLEIEKFKAVSFRRLARVLTADEIEDEVTRTLFRAEERDG